MKAVTTLLISLIFLSISWSSAAYPDTISKKTDSLNSAILSDVRKKLAESEQQRIDDSIKRSELELRISLLKTSDKLKKDELRTQLDALSDKENARVALKKAQIDSLRRKVTGFPVKGFFRDTLFFIYNKLGSFTALERAEAISERIKNLARTIGYSPDSLVIQSDESSTDILYNDRIIVSITESDAIWNNTTKSELAGLYRTTINASILKYKSETRFLNILKEIGLALLVLILLVGLIHYIRRAFTWTAVKIREQEGTRIRDFKIKNYTLLDKTRSVKALLIINSIAKWVFIILAIYIALPVLFGIFPWTKNLAETLFGYILNPVKHMAGVLWDFLPNLITIVVIIIIFRYVIKGIHFLKAEVETGNLTIPGFHQDWANPTYQLIRVLIYAFMIVVIYPYLPGSDSPIFRGVSVFLGFLFTFGSAGSLSNIISGLVLTYMRLFTIGDRVKIGDVTGDVIEKSVLVTRIRTTKNEIISIPNSTVMNSHTINYSSAAPDKGLILHTTVTIGYDVPWRDMHKALTDAALKTEHILDDPAPFVLQTSLDDFYVSYQINGYTREPNRQAVIYSNLHQNIQDTCNERGIEILSPHYRSARDGNMVSIPANYLPKDYKAPAFNVKIENGKDAKK